MLPKEQEGLLQEEQEGLQEKEKSLQKGLQAAKRSSKELLQREIKIAKSESSAPQLRCRVFSFCNELCKFPSLDLDKLQFDAASPPNPLPHRGGGISNLYLLRF